jgi:hypothetical protein
VDTSSSNPLAAYAFPAIALTAVALWLAYQAFDRLGLETRQAEARVTGKQFAPGATTYTSEVIDGRTYTRADERPDTYVVNLDLAGEAAGGAVSPQLYASLEAGERVRVRFRRTRVTKRLLVTDVSR